MSVSHRGPITRRNPMVKCISPESLVPLPLISKGDGKYVITRMA